MTGYSNLCLHMTHHHRVLISDHALASLKRPHELFANMAFPPKTQAIHSWLQCLVLAQKLFLFVQNSVIRRHLKHQSIRVDTLITYHSKLPMTSRRRIPSCFQTNSLSSPMDGVVETRTMLLFLRWIHPGPHLDTTYYFWLLLHWVTKTAWEQMICMSISSSFYLCTAKRWQTLLPLLTKWRTQTKPPQGGSDQCLWVATVTGTAWPSRISLWSTQLTFAKLAI